MQIKKILIGIFFMFSISFLKAQWTDGGTTIYNTTSTDKVGIGTTSASGALDIRCYAPSGGTAASVYFTATSDAYPRIYMGGTNTTVAGLFMRSTTGASFYMGEDTDTGGYYLRGKGYSSIGSGRITLSSSNAGTCLSCVGIGITNPLYKLQTVGSSRFQNSTSGTIGYVDLVPAGSGSTPSSIEIASGGTITSSQIDFKGKDNLADDFRGRIKYTDGTGFAFQVNETATDRMVITEGGAVGIGITPATNVKLHVYTEIAEFAKFEYNSANFIKIIPLAGRIDLAGSGSGFSPLISFIDDYDGSSVYDCQINYIDGTGLSIGMGTSNVFRIKPDGKVILGDPSTVTSTADYKLFVDGGILCEGVKVALCCTTDWSDFVFDPGYEMLPLDSVEKFVNANCHLPGVPSADDMVKNGVDLAKMDALLLQKIEELTLYMIQLRKENEDLQAEIDELKKK